MRGILNVWRENRVSVRIWGGRTRPDGGLRKRKKKGKKENLVRRCREPALEKLMQQQTHRLCQEPFWIRSSANTFSSNVLCFWSLTRFLDYPPPPCRQRKKVAALLFLFVVSKIVPASAFSPLYVRCFVPLPPSPKTDFSGFCPNEALSPFPWRQSQNCQVPRLKKSKKKTCSGGVLQLSETRLQRALSFLSEGEPLTFAKFSHFLDSALFFPSSPLFPIKTRGAGGVEER